MKLRKGIVIDEDFEKALRKLRVWTKFVVNMNKYRISGNMFPIRSIISSFLWRDTNEGVEYWADMYGKTRKILEDSQ